VGNVLGATGITGIAGGVMGVTGTGLSLDDAILL
jgi:hypothetical protein